MKKIENQTVYQCSYCSKISKSVAGIYQHEKFCRKNPHNNFICTFCIHLRKEEYLSEEDDKCLYICRWLNHSFMPFTPKQELLYQKVKETYQKLHKK